MKSKTFVATFFVAMLFALLENNITTHENFAKTKYCFFNKCTFL